MDNWEKFNETSLPKREEFYSNLNMEDITDADYMHAKRVCKDFERKNLGEYHNLYLKSDTSLLVDVFQNFRKMCLKISNLYPPKLLSAPGLACQATLKKTEVKLLFLFTDIDMLLVVEYLLEVDVQYPEKFHGLHNDLQFLPERMKIEKVEKLVTNLQDKTAYVIYIIFLDSTKLKIVWKKNNMFLTTRFNHTMIFFKLTD